MMAGMPAPTRDPEPLWLFLNRWLKEHGWAQVRLADAVGVHETVVGRWLHADARRRARPSRQTLPRLAEVLGVPVQDLVVMTIADQTRNPATEAAGRARLKTQLQAVEEQYERWIAAVGIENEGYFWRHLKSQGDSTVDLIRGLGTAVNQPTVPPLMVPLVSPVKATMSSKRSAGWVKGEILRPNRPLASTRVQANGALAA